MRRLGKKTLAGILVTALCMQAWTFDSGVIRVQAEDEAVQNLWGDEEIFTTEDGWKYCYAGDFSEVEESEERPGIEICGYEGSEKDLKVPEKIEGKVVWSIGTGAFMDSDITSIQLPKSVINFGVGAFERCKVLESVMVYDCETQLNAYCDAYVSPKAFSQCISLKNITLSKGIEYIERDAFEGCSSMREIVIPEGVRVIGQGAFVYCDSLERVKLPDSVEEIKYIAFQGCKSLTDINFPKNLKKIEQYIMKNCTSLETIEIPGSLKIIDEVAFSGCTALKNVVILSGTEKIDNLAFENCTSLESITIPATVREIYPTAFEGCGDFTVYTTKATFAEDYAKNNEINCVVEEHAGDVYTIQDDWQYKIKDDGVEIVYYTGAESQVVIPDTLGGKTVTAIGELTFAPWKSEENNGFTEITIPASIKTIGNNAFRGCPDLKNVIFAKEDGKNFLEHIGESAFENCCKLESITIPLSVKDVGSRAFYQCKELKKVVIEEGVEELGDYIFYDCSKLAEVVIPESVNRIGAEAFTNCNEVTIYAVENTHAEYYAKENGIHCITTARPEEGDKEDSEDDGDKTITPETPTVSITPTITEAAATPTGIVSATAVPTVEATAAPTTEVTVVPTVEATAVPTVEATVVPTVEVTAVPTIEATAAPTTEVTAVPTVEATAIPTIEVTAVPTVEATAIPTIKVTAVPTIKATATPMVKATATPTAAPAKVKVPTVKKVSSLKVSAKKKALAVSWKKLSNISGYQIQVSTKSSFKGAKTITVSKSKTKYTASKLKAKKKYYVRIRGYKTYKAANGKNKKAYGSWRTVTKKTK